MPATSTMFDKAFACYDKLPVHIRHSAVPWMIVSSPAVINSLFGAFFVMPFVIICTVILLYMTTKHTDQFIFSLSKMQARLAITIPLCSFISVWGITLAFVSRKEMMLGIVGPYTALLLIAAAPAYRWRADRKKRRLPLVFSFSIAGIIAALASIFYINITP